MKTERKCLEIELYPQKDVLTSSVLVPQNVILFGHTVFTKVMKLKWLAYGW